MSDREIILNRVGCRLCKDVITSHHRHDYVTCKCGAIFTDGGRGYIRRGGRLTDYIDMTIMSDEPFAILRDSLYRGGRGKSGTEPLHWVALSSVSNDYLDAIIKYQEDTDYTDSIDYKLQLQEKQYRKDNDITISEE